MDSPGHQDEQGAGGAARPRALIVSIRRLNRLAGWCSNYEFEDVIRAVDDVDVLELEPAPWFDLRKRVALSVAWRSSHRLFSSLNPGARPVTLRRDYDVLVFVCMDPWDLLFLNAVRGWRERCRTKLCFMVELYPGQEGRLGHLLRLLEDFDHRAISFATGAAAAARFLGAPCHHVPLASDVRRFTPFPDPAPRTIDVLSVGRRSEHVHAALRQLAAPPRRLFYVHDTIPGSLVKPSIPAEHRDMYARYAQRSRLFIAFPAKFGGDENQGHSEVGARYFEGAAAGAVLLGQAPTSSGLREAFPWPEPVVEARPDGSDVARILERFREDPGALERMSARNASAALRRHDWAHRWQTLLRIGGIAPRPALADRLRALEALADRAGATT